ncbi:MAG TPA: hypothetical protein VNG33_18470 [Polyangiaceae bacterium]|nr:hypothetical protein [Polyangiaceae bacterium]
MAVARPREVSIELTEGEYIAPRGTRELTWLIRLNDAWVHISEWPQAEIERCQATSGTVWENRTRLSVPAGALLTRVESRPAPYVRRDALDYLKRSPAVARRVLRQEFHVGSRGSLIRKP